MPLLQERSVETQFSHRNPLQANQPSAVEAIRREDLRLELWHQLVLQGNLKLQGRLPAVPQLQKYWAQLR